MDRINVSRSGRLGYVLPEGERLGQLAKLQIWCSVIDDSVVIDLLDHHRKHEKLVKRAFTITLEQDSEYPEAYTVAMVCTDREYRGFNLAPKLYRRLLKIMPSLLLKAGSGQSQGGRYIWNELAKYPDLVVYAVSERAQILSVESCDVLRELELEEDLLYDGPREYAVFAHAL